MAEYNGYTGVWRRLKSGAAIFIRDGEDIKSAVRRSFNSQKLVNKRKDIISREERAFEFEQGAKKDKLIAFREKGELSKEYDDAVRTERAWKKEQDKLRQERYDVEDEQQRITSRNRFGMQIKKDQFDRLKEVGQVSKNQADFENAYLKMVNKKSNDYTEEDLKNSIKYSETEKKYRSMYGQEASNEMQNQSFEAYQNGVRGSLQTKQMTPKQKATKINEANKDSKIGMKKNEYTSQELKDKYGTDNLDIINAGKAKEDRVSLKENNDSPSDIANAIRKNQLKYDENVDGYAIGDIKKGYYVQFQDREKVKWEEHGNIYHEKTESFTWARIWKDGELVKEINDSKYGARKQAADYLEKANTNKFKAEVSRTPKQRAEAINSVNSMSKEELVRASVEQTAQIDKLRGYSSGLRKEHLEKMSEETLRKIYLENKKKFNL